MDIDGDGHAREILPAAQPTFWFESVPQPNGSRALVKHVISEKPMNFGCGVGDLNGDGRPDVLRLTPG
ncbi:MAG: VCBS repeat-containing protein [Verrucomicrobiales bacterium]|nr:VCBS repeat-containing protein [Verrucomicrobiales bacterium]